MIKTSKPPVPETDEGKAIMTKKFLVHCCEFHGGYSTPELNDKLYANGHYLTGIDCIEEFTDLKCLSLEFNNIPRIENLSHMTKLRTLFLKGNQIKKIEGLHTLVELDTLVLESNGIEMIEGLENCKKLTKLDLSKNRLSGVESLEHLKMIPSLKMLLLKENIIPYQKEIFDFFVATLKVRYLELMGNTFLGMPQYRKRMIVSIPSITWLDERGVDDKERQLAEAFLEGGAEGCEEKINQLKQESDQKHKAYLKEVSDRSKEAEAAWREASQKK